MTTKFTKKPLPKSTKLLSKEELLEILAKKRECNARALIIVETLCEPLTDESWFLANLIYINQSHYDDVVTERSILSLCGYPLCSNKLGNVPKQQYRISLTKKAVFDITERKKYCSHKCFTSGEYVKNQLLTSPLWFRDSERVPEFKLLPKTPGHASNEECNENAPDTEPVSLFTCAEPAQAQEKVNRFDEYKCDCLNAMRDKGDSCADERCNVFARTANISSLSNCSVDKLSLDKIHPIPNSDCDTQKSSSDHFQSYAEVTTATESRHCVKDIDTKLEVTTSGCQKGDSANSRVQDIQTSALDVRITDIPPKTSRDSGRIAVSVNPEMKENCDDSVGLVEKIEKAVDEWLTIRTLIHLVGEDAVRVKLKHNEASFKEMSESATDLTPFHQKFDELTKVFSLLNFVSDESPREMKPLPDYAALKAESEDLTIKVRAFYSGCLEVAAVSSDAGSATDDAGDEKKHELPLVDSHAQNVLRRRVFLERLNRILPDICLSLDLGDALDAGEVSALVKTFSLSAHNLTFKPREWYLLALVLIRLLALKNGVLRGYFFREVAKQRTYLLLLSYNLSADYLDNLVEWLLDPEHLLFKLRS